MTQRIEPLILFFSIWLKMNFFFWSTKTQRIEFFQYFSNFFLYDSKNWTLFCLSMTQRIELFLFDSKNWTLFFWIWLKELNYFSVNTTQRIEPFCFFNMTQRIEHFFLNATQWIEPFFLNMTWQWIEPFFNMTRRIQLFFQKNSKNDSKNWNFLSMTQRIEPFFLIWRKEFTRKRTFISLIWMTPRSVLKKNLNWTSFQIWLKEVNFFE